MLLLAPGWWHLAASLTLRTQAWKACCTAALHMNVYEQPVGGCRQAEAFQAWLGVVRGAAALEQAGATLAVQLQHRRLHTWLKAWHLHCLHKQMHERMLTRLLSSKAQSRLSGTFHAWSGYVASFR